MQLLQDGRILDLILFLGLAAIMYYYIQRVERGEELPSIRTLPAFEAIEEGVGRAVETGQMVFFESGFGTLTRGPYVPMTMAGMNVLRHVSRLCARLGAKLQFGATATEVLPLAEGIMEESYRIEGKADEFNEDMVRYFGSGFSGNMAEASYIVREGTAALIMVGAFSTSCLVLLGSSARAGAITIGGTGRWIMMYAFGIAANYIFILEDIYAAAALASQDPTIITTLAGEDIIKLAVIVITILGIFLQFMGLYWCFPKVIGVKNVSRSKKNHTDLVDKRISCAFLD